METAGMSCGNNSLPGVSIIKNWDEFLSLSLCHFVYIYWPRHLVMNMYSSLHSLKKINFVLEGTTGFENWFNIR